MAIDFASADVDVVGSIDGFQELPESRLITSRWNDPRAGSVGYWRVRDDRMTRGRITLLPYGRNAGERQDREQDYVQLRRYGSYKSNDAPGSWQPWRDPFLAIIQRGGIVEFDAQQIKDLGWHRRPVRNAYQSHRELWAKIDALMATGLSEREAIDQVMPALAGVIFEDAPCELCPGKIFSSLALKHRHDSIVHKEEVRSRETREAIAQAISESGGQNADLLSAITQAIQALAANQTGASEAPRRGRPPKAIDTDD